MEKIVSKVIRQEPDAKGSCAELGHNIEFIHGPYYKFRDGYRADLDDTKMYFLFYCRKCGRVVETGVPRTQALDMR